jgi:hypothetical protein
LIVVVVGAVGHAFLFKESSHGLRSHHKTIVSHHKVSGSTEFGVGSRWCWEGSSVGGYDRVGVGVGVGGGVVGGGVVGVGVVGVGVEIVVAFSIVIFVVVGSANDSKFTFRIWKQKCIMMYISKCRKAKSRKVAPGVNEAL